jgi:hypothetical protein
VGRLRERGLADLDAPPGVIMMRKDLGMAKPQMIMVTSAFHRAGVLLAFCIAWSAFGTSPVTFRAVTNMNRYDQPFGLIEGSPRIFYVVSGFKPAAALSVSTQGSKVTLASFPSIVYPIVVSGAELAAGGRVAGGAEPRD